MEPNLGAITYERKAVQTEWIRCAGIPPGDLSVTHKCLLGFSDCEPFGEIGEA